MGTALRKTGYEILDIDIVKGKGCYVYDETGVKYLDFESGVWCCALGHSNSIINNAIKEQIDEITHTGYTFINKFADAASDIVLDILNMENGKCSFLSSGTEAVELAVKVGRSVSKEKLTLVLSDQYFGSYGAAMRKDSKEFYTFNYNACLSCDIKEDCNLSCPQLSTIPFNGIATFLFEPGGKGGLAKFPPKGLVKNLERLTHGAGGYIIVNEVTTGLGRTGKWFGFQHYDLKPDIVAMGKILGNGYPVSTVALNHVVSEELDKVEFHYGQSHTNDPLSCIVAKEVINALRNEKLVERSNEIGTFFLEELNELARKNRIIKEVRGRGLTICVEFNDRFSQRQLTELNHKFVENGYIVGIIKKFNSIRFMPPFILTKDEILEFMDCFENILSSTINRIE